MTEDERPFPMPRALPPLLLTSEPGSFAQRTFQTRIPRILDDVIAANDYPPEIVNALRALRAEIIGGTLQPLREDSDDTEFWNAHAREHIGKTWLELPWFWAETFFYRRVLEATRYFQPGDFYARDPYATIKQAELPDALRAVTAALEHAPDETTQALRARLHASLWGNRVDLSMLGAITTTATDSALLLVDDSARVEQCLRDARGKRVDFICDNAGTELCFDLALADFLSRAELASEIVLHLKPYPTFVSDATMRDTLITLDALGMSDAPAARQLARRLANALSNGRLVLSDHPFWVMGFFFHDLPDDLRATLARATLVICKGDANYRRLIGDCHWDPTTRFEETVAYFPASVVALRTLKAELIVGLRAGQAEQLDAAEPAWRVNGTRGVIQFAPRQDG